MPNWIVQGFDHNQPFGGPLEPLQTAEEALRAVNDIFSRADGGVDEVTVYHRLCRKETISDFDGSIEDNVLPLVAEELERKARWVTRED